MYSHVINIVGICLIITFIPTRRVAGYLLLIKCLFIVRQGEDGTTFPALSDDRQRDVWAGERSVTSSSYIIQVTRCNTTIHTRLLIS